MQNNEESLNWFRGKWATAKTHDDERNATPACAGTDGQQRRHGNHGWYHAQFLWIKNLNNISKLNILK